MSTISMQPAYVHHRSQVRLTRRGRMVVLALALMALLGLGIAIASASAAGNGSGGTPDVHVVTVQSGDTLWDIASDAAAATGTKTGDMVQRLEDLNPITDGMVYTGQEIRVPN